ncbi:hypothetical protein [Streptomyces sp. NPDC047043]
MTFARHGTSFAHQLLVGAQPTTRQMLDGGGWADVYDCHPQNHGT